MASNGANLFPVAKGVQLPFVGKDLSMGPISPAKLSDTKKHMVRMGNVKQSHSMEDKKEDQPKKPTSIRLTDKSKGKIAQNYLKSISNGLSFAEDVINERVDSKLYQPDEREKVFSEIKKLKKKSKGLVGRHDTRFNVTKHYPCFTHEPVFDRAENIADIVKKPLPGIKAKRSKDSVSESSIVKSKSVQKYHRAKPQVDWDEHILSLLSKETAELVIKEYTFGSQQKKLNKIFDKDNVGTVDENLVKEHETKNKSNVVKKQTNVQLVKRMQSDSEDTVENNEAAKNISYLKELSKGSYPISSLSLKSENIILDSHPISTYGKVLETSYPTASENWYDWKSRSGKSEQKTTNNKVVKGMHKWKDYPELIEDNQMHKMNISAVTPTSFAELDSKMVRKQREDANLIRIVQEWRGRWFLEKRWESSSEMELLKGMCDINDHVRLSAVSACSKAFLNKKVMEAKRKAKHTLLMNDNQQDCSLEMTISSNILAKIVELLSDRSKQVQVASAITLFALNKANQKAKEILLETVASGGPPEKWAAAQCLAYSGCDADVVVNEIINNINSTDLVKHSKAVKMLSRLSLQSTTVQFTLAEQLNSSSWRDRVVACQVFPSLQGPLSKDIANKISHLMWNDWSKDVRTAAARALGRTGNGKLVHDKLRDRLISSKEIEKLDALRKISFLGIMTGRLLPGFLECLRSDYVSIRLEAVMAVSAIQLSHGEVVSELLELAKKERNWKVKAHCIKAIGIVAKPTENAQEVLLWCLRYEKEAAVRAEACQAIRSLKLNSERVVNILQDRMDVEEDTMVQREVSDTLNEFGLEPTGDLSMIKAIQKEVKRLCNRDDIAKAIVDQDIEQRFEENRQKYLTAEDEDEDAIDGERSPQGQGANVGTEMKFDPVLEAYKIRSKAKISIPSIPDIPGATIEYDVNSNSGDSAGSEFDMDYLDGPGNFDDQTTSSYSPAVTL